MNRFKSSITLRLSVLIVVLLLAASLFRYDSKGLTWADWTGFGKDENISREETLQKNGKFEITKKIIREESGKTLWDCLGLAGVIAIPIFLFLLQQRQQEIADTNLREEALRDYIDKIAELLIDKELKILLKQLSDGIIPKNDPKLDAALDVARARTLSILRRLEGDGNRKGSVVHFLYDADLVDVESADVESIEKLNILKDTNLTKANVSFAQFHKANLSKTDFSQANLVETNLSSANLSQANLSQANLYKANLVKTSFSQANLSRANLLEANLLIANLFGANLSGANLSRADLSGANLTIANLFGANLTESNLSGAILSGVKNLTLEQVKVAKNWEQAIYNPELREQLCLPPENIL